MDGAPAPVPVALANSHIDKLAGVHPQLIEIVKRIIYAMNDLGIHMLVTDGVRTVSQQAALYAQGRTKPGPIVTNADGVISKSNHQVHADGLGHAVDMTFADDRGNPTWADNMPWGLYGAMAQQQGCIWGGAWAALKDRPHIELPDQPNTQVSSEERTGDATV